MKIIKRKYKSWLPWIIITMILVSSIIFLGLSSPSLLNTTPLSSSVVGYSPVDIVTQSNLVNFQCNCNWAGNSGNPTYFTVPRPVYVNTLAFFSTDRAYDPNNQSVSIVDSSGSILSTGMFSINGLYGMDGAYNNQWYPVQLNNVILLQPGITYKVLFGGLPNECYSGYVSGSCYGPVTENFFGYKGSYAGQSYFPTFEVGLMNLLPQGISYRDYDGTTDLQNSLNSAGWVEVAFMFTAQQSTTITQVSTEFINRNYPSPGNNQLVVSLRPNIPTINGITSPHPSTIVSQMASGSISISSILSNMQSCNGAFNGQCSWPNITITGQTQITQGQSYWFVFNATGNFPLMFERLVNPSRSLVYMSKSDYTTDWTRASDGPTGIPFIITTTSGQIADPVIGDAVMQSFSFGAQSFMSPTSQNIKGVWLENIIPSGNSYLNISIVPSGSGDFPGTQILASGISPISNSTYNFNNFISFNRAAQINSNAKYWLRIQNICLGGCSNPSRFTWVAYKPGFSFMSYGGGSLHAETSSDSVNWNIVNPLGSIIFTLATTTGYEQYNQLGSSSTTSVSSTSTTSTTSTSSSTSTMTTFSTSDQSPTVAIIAVVSIVIFITLSVLVIRPPRIKIIRKPY